MDMKPTRVFGTLLALFQCVPVYPCICAKPSIARRIFDAKTVLFVEPISREYTSGSKDVVSGKVKLKVLETFKGKSAKYIWKEFSLPPNGCDEGFFPGTKYLVFMDDKDTERVTTCHIERVTEITPEMRLELAQQSSEVVRTLRDPNSKNLSQRHYLAGMVAYQNKKFEIARDEWNLAIQLDPDNADAKAGIKRLSSIQK